MPPLLEMSDVAKSYVRGTERVRALDNVDLQLRPGELVGLVGRSGSGKSTLLNVIARWEQADSGRLWWKDDVVTEATAPPPWSDLAMVPQSLGLVDELTVRRNIELPARLSKRRERAGQRVSELISELGLADLGDRYPTQISIGQQQRAALARSVFLGPALLVADEPTGHQDAGWAHKVFELLRAQAASGRCCLVATHNHAIERFADRIAHIKDGRIN